MSRRLAGTYFERTASLLRRADGVARLRPWVAIGLALHDTQNAIRFSLGFSTTADDVARVVALAPALVERLRAVTAGATSRGRDGALASREA